MEPKKTYSGLAKYILLPLRQAVLAISIHQQRHK